MGKEREKGEMSDQIGMVGFFWGTWVRELIVVGAQKGRHPEREAAL